MVRKTDYGDGGDDDGNGCNSGGIETVVSDTEVKITYGSL